MFHLCQGFCLADNKLLTINIMMCRFYNDIYALTRLYSVITLHYGVMYLFEVQTY